VSFSFCSPSRGPTSTIFTHLGRSSISWKHDTLTSVDALSDLKHVQQ
jgi:hypothetical protein